MKKKRMIKTLIILVVLIGSLSACKATPKEEAIKQKGDISKVVANNEVKSSEEDAGGGVKIKDIMKAEDKTEFEVKLPNDKVDILVNASVIVPDVSEVPVYEVVRKDFVDADVSKISKIFFGDSKLYPTVTYENMTKNELLQELSKAQERKDALGDQANEKLKMVADSEIGTLQSYIDKAPESIDRGPIELKLEKEPGEGGGDSYSFSAQGDIGGVKGYFNMGTNESYSGCSFYKENAANSDYNTRYAIADSDGEEAADMENTCKYSVEEATALCEDIITKLGVEGIYSVSYVDDIAQGMPSQGGSSSYIGYQIKYNRKVGGLMETADYYDGNESNEEQDNIPYSFETMYFRITDQGVEQFIWNSPMELGEKQAENVTLLDYSQIEDIFKNQMALKFADVEDTTVIHVNEIKFGLMRVLNKDKQDEFTLVPTWDFISDVYGRSSILTINAIDGSILDRRYGY